jgi:hypothetical protein
MIASLWPDNKLKSCLELFSEGPTGIFRQALFSKGIHFVGNGLSALLRQKKDGSSNASTRRFNFLKKQAEEIKKDMIFVIKKTSFKIGTPNYRVAN